VPLIDGAMDLARMGLIPAGTYRNRDYLKGKVEINDEKDELLDILFDPQTSGGLLIAVPEEKVDDLIREIHHSTDIMPRVIGFVTAKQTTDIKLV
jgi:selenide,water dikinase